MARPTSGQARVFGLAADDAGGERRHPPPHRLRQRGQGPLRLHDGRGDRCASPRRSSRAGARDLEQRYLRSFELPPTGRSRRCRAACARSSRCCWRFAAAPELLVLDEPTSGLDPAATEEVLQAIVTHVAARRADRVVLVAPARRSRADCRSRRHRRSRPHRRGRGARRSARAATAASSWCSTARRRRHVSRARRRPRPPQGRVLTVLSSAGADRILDEARAFDRRSVDVVPVTLKEIFLETVAVED